MKPFRISEYLKKYLSVIITVSLISGLLCFVIVELFIQKYTAQAIISYNYEDALNGYAPDGTELDVSAIYASNIIADVIENLNIDKSTQNADEIRGSITVEPLYTDEEIALEEAQLKEGKEYKRRTDTYLISFSSKILNGKEYPRKILNEVLDVYSKWFAENHINNSAGTKDIKGILEKNYDYFEMLETIEESIENNVSSLSDKLDLGSEFRSYRTGYGFLDLSDALSIIKEKEIPTISSYILKESITKNKSVLLAKYESKNASFATQNKALQEELDYIANATDSYVTLMEDSNNTDITSEYILNNISSTYGTDSNGNTYAGETTTEYDRLMSAYVDDRLQYEINLIDTDFNKYITSTFENNNTKDADLSSQVVIDLEETISNLVNRVDNLYTVYSETNDEFNEYLGAEYVNNLSSTSVTEKIPVVLLVLGVVLLFGVIGCGVSIVLGRITDIIDYYAYTDHTDGLPNRAKLDRVLEERGKKSLVDDFACVNFKLMNLHEINVKLGRERGDECLRNFANVLTSIFEPSEKVFVANNGPGYYCVFAEGYDSKTVADELGRFRRDMAISDSKVGLITEFQEGYAVAKDDQCYDIKQLMLLARRKLQAANEVAAREEASYRRPVESTIVQDDRNQMQGNLFNEKNLQPEGNHQEEQKEDLKVNIQSAQKSSEDDVFDLNMDYLAKFKKMQNFNGK